MNKNKGIIEVIEDEMKKAPTDLVEKHKYITAMKNGLESDLQKMNLIPNGYWALICMIGLTKLSEELDYIQTQLRWNEIDYKNLQNQAGGKIK